MKPSIKLTYENATYKAEINGRADWFELGDSPAEAVGKAVLMYSGELKIEIFTRSSNS